jgi:hypothetical protein
MREIRNTIVSCVIRDATNPKTWDLLSHGLDLNLDLDLVWTLVWICYQGFGFEFGFDIKDLDLVMLES